MTHIARSIRPHRSIAQGARAFILQPGQRTWRCLEQAYDTYRLLAVRNFWCVPRARL